MIITDQMRKAIRYGVLRRGLDECWPWRHHKTTDGRGQLKISGQCYYVHRIVYQIAYGNLQDDLVVRHTCDNPACCNPVHLVQGTQLDNIRDRVERGRCARGEANGKSKITQAIANEIRWKAALGYTQRALEAEYKTSRRNIRAILAGITWLD